MSKPEKIQRLRAERDQARARADQNKQLARARASTIRDLTIRAMDAESEVAARQGRLNRALARAIGAEAQVTHLQQAATEAAADFRTVANARDAAQAEASERATLLRQTQDALTSMRADTGVTVQRLVDERDNAQAEVEQLREVQRAADQRAADQARIIASLRSQADLVGEAVAIPLPDPAVPTEETREQALREAAAALTDGIAQTMDLALVQHVSDERLAIMQEQTGTIEQLERDLELSQGTVTAYETASKAWERRALDAERQMALAIIEGEVPAPAVREATSPSAAPGEHALLDAEYQYAAEVAAIRERDQQDGDGHPWDRTHPGYQAMKDRHALLVLVDGFVLQGQLDRAAIQQWQERADQAVQETVEAERLHRDVAQHLEAAMRRYTHAEGQRDEQSAIADRAAQAADRYATQLAEAEARRAREDQPPGIMAEPVTPSDAALLALASMGAAVAEIGADVASRVADAGRILFR